MPTYITDTALEQALAAHLKIASVDDLPESSVVLLAECNLAGYGEIQSRLINRGFTQAQIDGWDRRVEFNRDISLFWLLVHAANLTADDLWVNKLDRRAELDTVALTVGGIVVAPGETSGGFSAGRISTEGDRVTRETKW